MATPHGSVRHDTPGESGGPRGGSGRGAVGRDRAAGHLFFFFAGMRLSTPHHGAPYRVGAQFTVPYAPVAAACGCLQLHQRRLLQQRRRLRGSGPDRAVTRATACAVANP